MLLALKRRRAPMPRIPVSMDLRHRPAKIGVAKPGENRCSLTKLAELLGLSDGGLIHGDLQIRHALM